MATCRWTHLKSLLRYEPLWTEFWSGVGAILWAKLLYWQAVDLDAIPQYRYITELMPDEYLESAAFVGGILQVVVVAFDCKWGRCVMAILAALFWLIMAWSLWLGNHLAPAAAAYLTLGLQNLGSVVLVRLRPLAR